MEIGSRTCLKRMQAGFRPGQALAGAKRRETQCLRYWGDIGNPKSTCNFGSKFWLRGLSWWQFEAAPVYEGSNCRVSGSCARRSACGVPARPWRPEETAPLPTTAAAAFSGACTAQSMTESSRLIKVNRHNEDPVRFESHPAQGPSR
jgi:hypothetical protein